MLLYVGDSGREGCEEMRVMVPVVSSEPGAHKVHRAWAHYLLYELHVSAA